MTIWSSCGHLLDMQQCHNKKTVPIHKHILQIVEKNAFSIYTE
ncbi:hypothetical protein DLNHIDIE_00986 [Acidithiobacillus thiooxidans ATCC 19377]|uniref:Uncharacterized protein n=1 Tax=Acidithiobacillus thiooxidans ATCC 19377 TaxID=637390 RepID=A0A543Q461_ACITH|nr:hypothetical protein DLNHIDIE_00986 [Acidithiobacillus thiooxidans ATCC 19377]